MTYNLISQLRSVKFANAWTSISNFYKDMHTENEKATANKFGSKFIHYISLRLIFFPIVVLWLTSGVITFGLLWEIGFLNLLTASSQVCGYQLSRSLRINIFSITKVFHMDQKQSTIFFT